ncbi:hypothetical protein DRQ29_04980 [bacterium]|nr:MAG: hypothetical protein DRQ29_04980 [bacterium]
MEWFLTISEKQFKEIYHGLPILKDIDLFRSRPTNIEEYKKASQSKLWRMNNWYMVIDKDGDKVWFIMNYAQHKTYARQLRHSRSIILKSRQRGISTFFLVDYFDDAITIDNLTVGMQSYGLVESAALLEKLTVAWENLAEINKQLLAVGQVKANTKAMGFTNGSQVKVATSFRGSTLHRLHVSELGKIANKDPKKAEELKTGTLQAIKAGNPVAIESTAEGQHNAFHEWWYNAVDLVGERALKDFDPVFLSWIDDPDCEAEEKVAVSVDDETEIEKIEREWEEYSGITNFVKHPDRTTEYYVDYVEGSVYDEHSFKLTERQVNWFVGARRELGDKFYQEYPHTPEAAFAAVHDGAYYARLWRASGHVKAGGLYDPALEVHTAWDLGRNDMMVIVFFQVHGAELRVVDEYHNHGESLEHYVNMMWEKRARFGYSYGRAVLPHDAKVTDLSSDISRKQVLSRLGLRGIRVLKRTKDVANDIEQVRMAIPTMWIDSDRCGYILKMMGKYTKKWDDLLGTFKDQPLHNEWSNPADAVRYMVMAKMHTSVTTYEGSGGQVDPSRGGKRGSSNVIDGLAM